MGKRVICICVCDPCSKGSAPNKFWAQIESEPNQYLDDTYDQRINRELRVIKRWLVLCDEIDFLLRNHSVWKDDYEENK